MANISNQNQVTERNTSTQVHVVHPDVGTVVVPRRETETVTVSAPGPQGIQGVQGLQGASAPFTDLGSGVWNTTSSIQVTGSFTVSGSSTFTNIGPAIFNGSVTINGADAVTTATLASLTASSARTASYLNTLNQDLTFNGNLTLNGTASISYLNVQYESASVIYSSGSNQLGDAANDTQTLYGSVIIPTGSLTVSGIVSSGNSLNTSGGSTVQGELRAYQLSTVPIYLSLQTTSGKSGLFRSNTDYILYYDTSTGDTVLNSSFGGAALKFNLQNSEKMRILSNGNVGIGTTTPSASLHIKSATTSSLSSSLLIENSSSAYSFRIKDNGDLTATSNYINISSYDTTINGGNNVAINGAAFNPGYIYRNGTTSGFLSLANDGTVASSITLFGSTHATLPNLIRVVAPSSFQITGSLDVSGTARTGDLTIGTLSSTNTISFGGGVNNTIFRDVGEGSLNFRTTFSNTINFRFRTNSDLPNANTTGTNVFVSLPIGFAPTSGTGTWTQLSMTPTINQTGGANGITRGLYINPTLTSAANFRAIEVASGSSILNGVVAINSTNISTGYALFVNGVIGASSLTLTQNLTMGENFAISNNGSQTIDIDANNDTTNAVFRVTANGTANELFRVNETGSFGIGTIAPSAQLHISGAASTSPLRVDTATSTHALHVTSNGYVGIGESSPSYALQVRGGIYQVNSGNTSYFDGQVRFGAGNSYSTTVLSNGRLGVGTITPIAQLHVSGSSGSVLFEVDSNSQQNIIYVSGSGNIGIGTSTPTKRLEIYDSVSGDGLAITRGAVPAQRIELIPNDSTVSALIKGGGNGKPFYIASWANGGIAQPLYFGTNYSNGIDQVRMTIDTIGNVGIGTTSPSYTLDVTGSAGSTARFKGSAGQATVSLNDGTTDNYIVALSGRLQLRPSGTTALTALASGNVGIGTTTPSENLHVSGNILIGQYASSTSLLRFANISNVDNSAYIGRTATAQFEISPGSVNEFRINTPAGTDTAALTIYGNGVNTAQFYRNRRSRFGGNLSTNPGSTVEIVGEGATSATTALRVQNSSATPSLVVLDNGFVGIGTGSAQYQLDLYGTYHQYQAQGGIARYDISSANANQNRGVWDFYTNAAVAPDFFGRFGFKFEGGTSDAFKQFQVHIADSTTPKFVIDGSGRMGIGTITPTAQLHITGSSNSGLLEIDSPALSDILYVSGSGNIGIGTRTPAYNLEVVGSNTNTARFFGGGGTAVVGIGVNGTLQSSGGQFRLHGNASVPLSLGSYGVWGDLWIINGNVGIGQGTTAPTLTSRFTIKGSGATSSTTALRVENTNTSASMVVLDNGNIGIGTTTPAYKLDVSGSTRFKFSPSGADLFAIDGATTTRYFIVENSNGFVGIGNGYTTSATPATSVDIRGNTSIRGGSATVGNAFIVTNTTPTTLLTVQNNGQVEFTSPTITLATTQSAFRISPIISASNTIGGQYYGVNITPTFFQTTGSQTETAFRVAATFSQSSAAATTGTNIIADFGSTSAGSQLTVTDVTSGSIYMVNDVSGLPIIEATSNWDVNIYDFPNKIFEKTGSQVNIYGTLRVSGSFILPLSQSAAPQIGSAYWSGSLLFIYNGTRYMSSSFA